MYRGFKLPMSEEYTEFYEDGLRVYKGYETPVREALNKFISAKGIINGSSLQSHWFPQVGADVFLSHSHKDKAKAISLAGWLWKTFELKTFIDSCIWGYANDLLKQIDNAYCLNEGGQTFNYASRNASTAHVHIMLSTALQMMIDKTECLIFLDTPKSISSSDAIRSKTNSAWIYAELVMVQLTRQNSKEAHREARTKTFSKGRTLNEGMQIEYEAPVVNLANLQSEQLEAWAWEWVSRFPKQGHPLDVLYTLVDGPNFL